MIPYHTLEESKDALGRNLTFAETVWFNYSAKKSDFVLHCHNTLFLCLFYSIAPIPFALIELSGCKKLNKYKIQPSVKRTFLEMFKCYKYVIKTFIIAVGPLQIVSYPFIKWLGIRTSLSLPSRWELFWQLLVYFLIEDYASYWIHRMLHCKWGYENIHKVHHEYKTPIGFAGPYVHLFELWSFGIPALLGPILVPGHIVTFWLWFILRQLEAIETHSGYEFPWSFTKYIPFYGGPTYHDYHHSVGGTSQGNFASVFTYCDYIYGTQKGYQYKKRIYENMSPSNTFNKVE
ncbi:methylsterol monooxygenase 1-2 [Lathyrus oleraceus]|uniref:Methylsterol monooxygenase 1-2 n=1 Tax=Pisum sativum TaxID=3888 RepID=A0A9D5B0F0_PEA|nr:methylsterol monooxygenase 1-2-like [Pisum sativum]KAI5428978.1 Methylsterol monooxygenase 1-2 [Pisum sativum]